MGDISSLARDWLFYMVFLLGMVSSAWFGAYIQRNKPSLKGNNLFLYLLLYGVVFIVLLRLIKLVC